MRIAAKTLFAEEGTFPEEVLFLLSGSVLKESKIDQILGIRKTYFIDGSIFGETDLMKNRLRKESYSTVTDCYILRMPKAIFIELLSEFDDFNEEVSKIAKEREAIRVARYKAYRKMDERQHG